MVPTQLLTNRSLEIGAAIVFVFVLALRLIFLLNSGDAHWPHSIYFEGDAPLFARWAAALDQDQAFESGLPLHSPVVAHLIHWFTNSNPSTATPAGLNFLSLKITWCAASVLTAVLLFAAVAACAGLRAGALAATLHALFFGNYLIATSLNNEGLYACGLVAVVLLTQSWFARPALPVAAILGLLHGVCTLLRAEHPLLWIALAGCMLLARPRRGAEGELSTAVKTAERDPDKNHLKKSEWRSRAGGAGLMAAVMLAVCLPWAISARNAIHKLNTVAASPIAWEQSPIVWSESARQLIESMPAFARKDNFDFISASLAARGVGSVDSADVAKFLEEQFHDVPEPMSEWVLVSSQGPLAFALANHPQADGGFSKAALDARFGANPSLQLSLPSHLRLYNRGYAAGWGWIRGDLGAWLQLAGRKLTRFWGGVAMGLTARNWPLERGGVREPTDLATAPAKLAWTTVWAVALGIGCIVSLVRRVGRIWLLVIVYKLVVTIAFFGYARQAVSIAPAFCTMAALGIGVILDLVPRTPAIRRLGWTGLAAIALSVGVFDFYTARAPAELSVRGPAELSPLWGANAFESAQRIELLLHAEKGR